MSRENSDRVERWIAVAALCEAVIPGLRDIANPNRAEYYRNTGEAVAALQRAAALLRELATDPPSALHSGPAQGMESRTTNQLPVDAEIVVPASHDLTALIAEAQALVVDVRRSLSSTAAPLAGPDDGKPEDQKSVEGVVDGLNSHMVHMKGHLPNLARVRVSLISNPEEWR